MDGGKGCYWSLGEVGVNTTSPSRARRPKYMKEFGKNKEEVEQPSAMDTSVDASVSGEANLTTQQLLQSISAAEEGEENPNPTSSTTTLENPPATQENHESASDAPDAADSTALHQQGKREPRPKKKKGKGAASQLAADGNLYPTLDTLADSAKGRVEEDSDILAADPDEDPQSQTPAKQVSVPSLTHFSNGTEGKGYLSNPKTKPPFSYMHLIGQAILAHDSERATLAEIISHIMKTYPYFREKPDPWDVSV